MSKKSKKQDAFFITIIALMLIGTAAINKAQAATHHHHHSKKAKAATKKVKKKATQRSYTIKGKRYHPIANAKNFVQTGRASWYGPGFHGKKTSNGERYNMHAMTAAHPTLPIPSYVRVTNLDNKKSVIVRINDRGPFHGKRIIDLSKAAASRLGFVKKGTAKVRIKVLDKSTRLLKTNSKTNNNRLQHTSLSEKHTQTSAIDFISAPKSLPQPQTPSSQTSTHPNKPIFWNVQQFSGASDATLFLLKTAEKMGAAGINHPMTINQNGKTYNVRIGPFKNHEQLEDLKQRLHHRNQTAI